jgi:hypothetical protein
MRAEILRVAPDPGDWRANRVLDLARVDTGSPDRDLAFIGRASALAERGVDVWARLEAGRLAAAWAVEKIDDESAWAGSGARGWLLYPLLLKASPADPPEGEEPGPADPIGLAGLVGALPAKVRDQLWAVSPGPDATSALERVGFVAQAIGAGADD